MRRISPTTFIKQVTSSILELVGEQIIKEAIYFTESPELCIKSVSIHGCLPRPTGYRADCKTSQPLGRYSSYPCLFLREVASPVNHPQQKASADLPLRSDEAPQIHWCKKVCWRAEYVGWNQVIHCRQFQAMQKCYYLSISLTRQARSDR